MVDGFIKYVRGVSWWSKHLGFPTPKIVLIAPPNINEQESIKAFKNIFHSSGPKIAELPSLMSEFAIANKILFFDSSKIVQVSPIDGVHLDIEGNHKLGRALAQLVKEVL